MLVNDKTQATAGGVISTGLILSPFWNEAIGAYSALMGAISVTIGVAVGVLTVMVLWKKWKGGGRDD